MPGFTKSLLVTSALFALSVGVAHADRDRRRRADHRPVRRLRRADEARRRDGGEGLNAKGGINGQKLQLQVGDDACDPKQAVAVANQFVNQGVVFVAGHFCSGALDPGLGRSTTKRASCRSRPASTNPKLTEQGFDNVFRTCGRDDVQGTFAANYVVDNKLGDQGRDRPRPDRLRQGPGRRVQEAAQRARRSRR